MQLNGISRVCGFLVLAVALGWSCAAPTAAAQEVTGEVPLPPGGTSVLPEDALSFFGTWGKTEMGSMETISVRGQPFAKAHRVTTLKMPPNQWELQYGTWIQKPVRKGDVLLVRFYLRAFRGQAETGEARTKVDFATGAPGWSKSMSTSVGIPDTWKQFNYPFVALFDTPVNGSLLAFDMGYPPQSFEIGGIQIVNYGNSKTVAELPRTRSDYAGQEDDAPWRRAALERIEKIRKGDLQLSVVDASGNPVPEATVTVRMRRHAFSFGSALAADRLVGTDANSDKYRQIILANYSAAVVENHLKWPFWEGTWTHPAAEQAVDWLYQNQIRMPISGPLVWGGWGNLPDDLKGKQNDPAYLLKRINDNMVKEINAYKGKISEWEVINEPYAQNDLWKLFGYQKMAEMFQEARRLAPDAHLTINDYPPLDGAAMTNEHLNAYYRYIEGLASAKAPLDGIGFQCHFGSSIIPPERVLSGLDRFAKFGLPISITEFDMETSDEDLQRRYMRDFMTAAFSHPAVDAIIMWGFWESQHWMPSAALYRSDWSIKPNGQMWLDLVKRDWWTNADGKTDAAGKYGVRGFYGVYEIRVTTPDGKSKTIYPTFTKGSAPVMIKLDGHNEIAPAWIGAVDNMEKQHKERLAAGIPLLANSPFNLLADKADGTSELVEVTGQTFKQATRFHVLHPTAQPWNVQALIVTQETIAKGDKVKVSFWMRTAPGTESGKITANFQTGGPEYAVFASGALKPTAAWQKVEMKFTAPTDRASGAAMLVLQLGHQIQAVEVGGVSALDFGSSGAGAAK